MPLAWPERPEVPWALELGPAPDRYLVAAGEAAPVPGPVLGTFGLLGSSRASDRTWHCAGSLRVTALCL